MPIGIRDLTRGERLYIWRRRENMSQAQAAEIWGVARNEYRSWENDEAESPAGVCPNLGVLETFESCVILRRRNNASVSDTAEAIGVSRQWLRKMEIGEAPTERLTSYWGI